MRCLMRVDPFLACLLLLLALFHGQAQADFDDSATIAEGRAAASELLETTGTSSISVAFVADGEVRWRETFVNPEREQMTPTVDTLYGIGSTSKMFATVAVMRLVDQGLIDLDVPLMIYLPKFVMLSPESSQITVRMLLNHSAGFPGSDYRNIVTLEPYPGYAAQVLQTLAEVYLKAAPGSLATYCNDCFTLIEPLVKAVTGRDYSQYVEEEILRPLGMLRSRYPTAIFPQGSYAELYDEGGRQPFEILNAHASGGLYSTPSELSRFALMLLGQGTLGEARILSPEAVAEMGADQIQDTFDPVPLDGGRFGLGWDSVTQPGLKAVGVRGWVKGGDTFYGYGTSLMLAPEEGLAALVSGTEGFGSQNGAIIAERILLRALSERGIIAEFPTPLTAESRPTRLPTADELAAVTGYFSSKGALYRLSATDQAEVMMSSFDGRDWEEIGEPLKLRDNGYFSRDSAPLIEFWPVEADGKAYLAYRWPSGFGHYRDQLLYLQRIHPSASLSAAWRSRLRQTWLMTNERPDGFLWADDPRLSLAEPPGLEGLLAVNWDGDHLLLDPAFSDQLATPLTVFLPAGGRDLDDLFVVPQQAEEWLRFGSYLFRPAETVPSLTEGWSRIIWSGGQILWGNVGIETPGVAEWRRLTATSQPQSLGVMTAGHWSLLDADFNTLSSGQGAASVMLPAVAPSSNPTSSTDYWLRLHQPAWVWLWIVG